MTVAFYIAAVIAILATLRVITHTNAVHALLYMITSLIAVAVIFFIFGAPYLAAIEVIVYAGAIMVLFVFVAIMLNLGRKESEAKEQRWLSRKAWVGPAILCLILLGEVIYVVQAAQQLNGAIASIAPKQVGVALYTKYILGVELTGVLLVSAIVGAYHIGRHKQRSYHRFLKDENSDKNMELT